MRLLRLLLFISFLCSLNPTVANAQYERFLHQDKLELDRRLTTFWNDRYRRLGGDTAIHMPIHRQIQALAVEKGDYLLQRYNCLFELRILERGNIANEFYQQKLEEYVQAAQESGDKGIEAAIENRAGEFYRFKLQNYELAFRHFNKMLELDKNLSVNDYPSKLFDLEGLLYLSNNFKEYENTINIAKKLLRDSKKSQIPEWNFDSICLYMIGRSYEELYIKDSALFYLSEAVQVSRIRKDTFKIALSEGYLGEFYFKINDFKSAIKHLKESVKYHKILRNTIGANEDIETANLTRAYLLAALTKANQSAEARALIGQIEQFSYFDTWQFHRPIFYDLLSRYYLSVGASVKALAYADSSAVWTKKNQLDFDGRKSLRVQQKLELERIEAKNRNTLFWRNVIVGFLLLMFVTSISLYLRHLNKKQQELNKTQADLERSKHELAKFKAYVREKASQKNAQEQNVAYQEAIKSLGESTILTKEEWEKFKGNFNAVHPNFFGKLKQKYPNLTEGEKRFFSLKKLGLSNKEMAQVLGISDQSIRTTLYRLRKNIDLSPDDDISKILENI